MFQNINLYWRNPTCQIYFKT